MSVFRASKLYDVPVRRHYGHLALDIDVKRKFWSASDSDSYRAQRGCYIFGVQHGNKFVPTYIGKATRTFYQEVFTDHKKDHYNQALRERKNGIGGMMFVYHLYERKPNIASIDRLETQLIQHAVRKRLDLTNLRKKYLPRLLIEGVFDFQAARRPPGKSDIAAERMRVALKF